MENMKELDTNYAIRSNPNPSTLDTNYAIRSNPNPSTLDTSPPPKKLSRIPRNVAFRRQNAARKLLGDQNRIFGCLRHRSPFAEGKIKILQDTETNNAFYKGLMVCNSVWLCAPCAKRISDKRRQEVEDLACKWQQSGNHLLMLTITMPHNKKDILKQQLEIFQRAQQLLWASSAWKTLRKEIGYGGMIRCLEVTYGQNNGWHPHTHVLLFIQKAEVDCSKINQRIFNEWEKILKKLDWHSAPSIAAFTLQKAETASGYITKWGAAEELCLQSSKEAGENHHTPFQLLDIDESWANQKFLEYAAAFKGKRQLVIARDLKKTVELCEQNTTSEDSQNKAETLKAGKREICEVPYPIWKRVRALNLRVYLLEQAEKHGKIGVETFLILLETASPEEIIRIVGSQNPETLGYNLNINSRIEDAA